MEKLKTCPQFGQKVKCFVYIKHSGNVYEKIPAKHIEDGFPMCIFWAADATEGVEVEDFHECERFKTIEHEFIGVFVGVTWLNTKILAEYCDDGYAPPCFKTQTIAPEKFAVVYYANNKKRLVPINDIEILVKER